jgi:coenzyme Q-binding protein COQ10
VALHRVTRILPYAPAQLAELVADVRAYPSFVPWVTAMRVWNERTEGDARLKDAEAQVGFSFLKERFSTAIRHDTAAPLVEVALIRGPFRHLRNRWEFHPHPQGTRLEFAIDFAFKSRLLDGVLHANFDRAVGKLIACFEAEAARRFGQRP